MCSGEHGMELSSLVDAGQPAEGVLVVQQFFQMADHMLFELSPLESRAGRMMLTSQILAGLLIAVTAAAIPVETAIVNVTAPIQLYDNIHNRCQDSWLDWLGAGKLR